MYVNIDDLLMRHTASLPYSAIQSSHKAIVRYLPKRLLEEFLQDVTPFNPPLTSNGECRLLKLPIALSGYLPAEAK
jgi:hypothetical protein